MEDLLQLHELVEADITVQAERVRAVSASALRFCDPGKGEHWGKELGSGAGWVGGGARKENIEN